MSVTRPALNPREPIADKAGFPTTTFLIYNRDLRADVESAPTGFEPVSLSAQGAAIGTTAIPTDGDLSAGIYRVCWHLRITTAAGVSSQVQITFTWTEGGLTQTYTGTAVNGNTTTTQESAPPILLRLDAASPISYAVTYASNPAGVMRFSLDITLERMAAL